MWNPVREVVRRVGAHNSLLLSHHPTCEYYSHHTFELYGRQLCMGCFVVYPVGFVSLLTLVVARLLWPEATLFGLGTGAFYALGFALIAPMVADKALSGNRSAGRRMAGKASLAVGLAFLAFPFVYRPAARWTTAGLFLGFLVPYVAYKGLTARDDCRGCPEAEDFPDCSGMAFDDSIEAPGFEERRTE